MVGTKHMPGNDCKDILLQITTLYTQVFKCNTTTGEPDPTQIVRRGIVKIDFAGGLAASASVVPQQHARCTQHTHAHCSAFVQGRPITCRY